MSEASPMAIIFGIAKYDLRPTLFVLLISLVQIRMGLMIGNWGQHALVDEIDPKSNFRSSITLIDSQVSHPCNN